MDGGHLLSHWRRMLSPTSDLALQVYYDHTARDEGVALLMDPFDERRHTVDVDAHFDADVRLSRKVDENVYVSLVGQNLIDAHHLEFRSRGVVNSRPSRVQRGIYGTLRWGF